MDNIDPNAAPESTPEPALPASPPDREPSAEPLDGAVVETPANDGTGTPEPVVTTAEPEPPFVAELKSRLEAQAQEIASLKGSPKPAEPNAPAQELSPEVWNQVEKSFGFEVQEHKNEDGSVSKSLNVNPRTLIKTVFAQFDKLASTLRSEFDNRLNENTADSRMDRAYFDMEKRTANPLTDIRQHAPEIKKYLQDFYNGQPQKWSDPKILEAAYWYSVGMKARNKPANPTKTDIKVIHPNTPRPAARPMGPGGITPQEREMMSGMISPRTGKPITDAEWISAKGNGR